jgi:uncharacterized DUF497 family protein
MASGQHKKCKRCIARKVYDDNIQASRRDVDQLSEAKGFDWDEWNAPKIWEKHSVSQAECEQVLFNEPLIVAGDAKHSEEERRYFLLGTTDQGRLLFLVFTLRLDRIRMNAARNMSRKERRIYRDVREEGNS